MATPLGLEHQPSRHVGLLDLQAHRGHLLAARRAFVAHRHERAHAAFVPRPAGLDALPQPDLLDGQTLVELLLLHGLVGEPLLFPAQKRLVVAGPRRELPAIDLDDARREPLEERAIVRDEHDGARVLGQERLEPRDGVDVEVVGRLVEHEQVRLGHQRARQERPAPPAARQRVHDGVGGQAELREHQLDALLDAPPVLLVELVLQPAERLERAPASHRSATSTAVW